MSQIYLIAIILIDFWVNKFFIKYQNFKIIYSLSEWMYIQKLAANQLQPRALILPPALSLSLPSRKFPVLN